MRLLPVLVTFSILLLHTVSSPQADPLIVVTGHSGDVSAWATSQSATDSLVPNRGLVSVELGSLPDFARASVGLGHSAWHVQTTADAEVGLFEQNPPSAEANGSLTFTVLEWVELTQIVDMEFVEFRGNPTGVGVNLSRDGTTLWFKASGYPVWDTCEQPLPVPLECTVLPPGTYTLTVHAEARGSDCGGCLRLGSASARLDFSPCGNAEGCPDPNRDSDADGVRDPIDNCPTVPNPQQVDSEFTAVDLRQWATSAEASSEWSSFDYGARAATGAPENPGSCLDVPTNWSPLADATDPEWIELTYTDSVLAEGVVVHEMPEAGFVYRVDAIDTTGASHTVWSGIDTTACGGTFEPTWSRTPYEVRSVVIHTQAPGWEEIDAVELVGYQTFADGVGDVCDSCPRVPNFLQVDSDGDGQGDECDCAPDDSLTRSPEPVAGLTVDSTGSGVAQLVWTPVAGADDYRVHRGDLATLDYWHYGSCLSSQATSAYEDADLPAPGEGWFYLVVGNSTTCGPGSLGFDASGRERVETDPAVCAD